MATNSSPNGGNPFEPLRVDFDSSTIELTSSSSPRLYRRQASWNSVGKYREIAPDDQDIVEARSRGDNEGSQGLGLRNVQSQSQASLPSPPPPGIRRVAVGSRDKKIDVGLFLPPSQTSDINPGVESQSTTAQATPYHNEDDDFAESLLSPSASKYSLRDQTSGYHHISSSVHLLGHQKALAEGCPTRGDVLKSRLNWYSSVIIILAIFSTIFSGIFLGIALRKPRWGGLRGMPIETATLLSALFSKLIELSFACVFVATLGQILSRKAFGKDSNSGKQGVSIAEINMRLWILQPGTLLTHWTGAWFALKSILGVVALLAAVAAAFYITAAEALVSPKLAFGKNETTILSGPVRTIYANARYLESRCDTPIPRILVSGSDEEGQGCMQVKHAGQGFRNFEAWNTLWTRKIEGHNQGQSSDYRPAPVAMIADNTTVRGQWIHLTKENITSDSERAGRLVHNVSLAMPHANIVRALREEQGNILQPEDLDGNGEYYVQAAVPAPALNVLCVGMTEDEFSPMMINNQTSMEPDVFPFRTAVDDLFGFTQNRSAEIGDYAPWFTKLPSEYNILVNRSKVYGNGATYILASPPKSLASSDFILCALKSSIYPNCTTAYHVAQAGSELSVHCADSIQDDVQNTLPYSRFEPNAPVWVRNQDWPSIGESWANAVGLSQGISDANASIARYLAQMSPPYDPNKPTVLNDSFPTLAEGLAALAGSTLLISSENSPFIHAWNYTESVYFNESDVKRQNFRAVVAYKDYASGNGAPWQGLFYLVLVAVFSINLFCLCYLLWAFGHDGAVTDYTEPQNLFALAINSPNSHTMSGSCGPGPTGDMLRKKWKVEMFQPPPSTTTTPALSHDHNHPYSGYGRSAAHLVHPHFYVRCPDDDFVTEPLHHRQQSQDEIPGIGRNTPRSPEMAFDHPIDGSPETAYVRGVVKSRFRPTSLHSMHEFWRRRSRQKARPVSMDDRHDPQAGLGGESPAFQQYMWLRGRR